MSKIELLKRKQSGKKQRENLIGTLKSSGLIVDPKFLDFEESYELMDFSLNKATINKVMSLNDISKEEVKTNISEPLKQLGDKVVLFFRNSLDAGGVNVDSQTVIDFYFKLLEELDGDSIYVITPDGDHGLYLDISDNNQSPNNCYELEVW